MKITVNKTIEKDYQQQNFLEILRIMQSVPGWEVLEESKVLALKAPGSFPFVNFVWGDVTSESLQTVFSFLLLSRSTGVKPPKVGSILSS